MIESINPNSLSTNNFNQKIETYMKAVNKSVQSSSIIEPSSSSPSTTSSSISTTPMLSSSDNEQSPPTINNFAKNDINSSSMTSPPLSPLKQSKSSIIQKKTSQSTPSGSINIPAPRKVIIESETNEELATIIVDIEPISAPHRKTQEFIKSLYEPVCEDKQFLNNVYKNCKINQRHFFYDINDLTMNQLGTDDKNLKFPELVRREVIGAGEKILQNSGIDKSLISHVVGVTSTGFWAPSIDAMLIRDLNLPDTAGRTMINFMGCGAAVIALRTAYVHARARPGTYVLVVCVEASSLNMDIDLQDRSDLVSSCIFSDGCVAALVSTQPRSQCINKIEIIDDISYMMPDSGEALKMHVGNHGIDLSLRPQLSSAISKHIKPAITQFLATNNMTLEDIQFWAVHPGGRKILEAVQDGLELDAEDLADSYFIMKWYGNMVSCSALYVLKHFMNSLKLMKDAGSIDGIDNGMVMAFSPGASI